MPNACHPSTGTPLFAEPVQPTGATVAALSLWQPWASLWMLGIKRFETRHWPAPPGLIGQPLAVHAAQKLVTDHDGLLLGVLARRLGPDWRQVPRGALLGVVTLSDCLHTEAVQARGLVTLGGEEALMGNFAGGRYAWDARERRALEVPVPFRGRQGVFRVPASQMSGDGCRLSEEVAG